ncbi:MAG: carbon-nitrogen hydrolase family protein [Acidobacteriota bacterium]
MRMLSLFLSAAALAAAAPPFRQSGFTAGPDGLPAGWRSWAARAEMAPKTFVDQVHSRGEPGSLAISGNSNAAAAGGWEYAVTGVQPGQWYRLGASYRADAVNYEPLQVVARLEWRTAEGKRAGQPDYAYATRPEGDWRRVSLEAPAPEKAVAVAIQLWLENAPQATVWWDDISLEPVAAPGPRQVTVAALNFRPGKTSGATESVSRFLEVIEKAVPGKADLILLGEGITVVGTGKKYAEVAETVPGPTTARLGEVAQKRNAYVAAGIYEREGAAIYNTAVLIDRRGRVAGKYRKVYLPREEIEGGLTRGDDYPVFQTDFGKVGMMICWDLQYADPARALALGGAELILLPIWGGNNALPKARAIENQVFLASSGYDHPTYILDPDGETLAAAPERGQAAIATLDLNRRYVDKWLGHMRGRFMKELRLDVPLRRPGFNQ